MSDRKLVPGKFVWFSLVTSNRALVQPFYVDLFQWKIRGFPIGATTYEMIFTGDTPDTMIGDFAPPPRPGERSRWVASVAVPDVDAAARTATQHGGKIVYGPSDIPGVGRVARITDPQGAELSLLTRTAGDTAHLPPAHGRWNWNELHTSDPAAAVAFYAAVVGFAHRGVDQGPDGTYHVLSTEGVERGGVTGTLAPGASPHWLPYVSVTSADATLARATTLGGKVLVGPFDIPRIGRFGVIEDPTGAMFAVLQALPRTA